MNKPGRPSLDPTSQTREDSSTVEPPGKLGAMAVTRVHDDEQARSDQLASLKAEKHQLHQQIRSLNRKKHIIQQARVHNGYVKNQQFKVLGGQGGQKAPAVKSS